MPESDLEAAESERHSSPDKNEKERGGERDSQRDRAKLDRVIYNFNLIQSCRDCNVCEGAVKR
jgi:hypothetical protein